MSEVQRASDHEINETEGVVKWFDPRKGYGFIVGPQGQDIFVHFSSIEGDGFRALKDGANVIYSATLSDKGWHASKVVRNEPVEVHVRKPQGYARTPRR